MQETNITYRNLGIFLISLLLINIAVGFYNSFSKKKDSKGLSVNYTIKNTKIFETNPSDVTVDYISESSEMIEIFNKYQFSVDNLLNNQSANLVIFSSLPTDFMDIQPIIERKRLFINTLIPIIYSENLQILNDRKKILDWWRESDGENFSRDFWPQWLFELSEKYGSSDSNLGNLLMRVDIIPISLALAQSAIESGWGTSRYSREGNAVFGQYTFDESKGLKPKDRNENDEFFIKKFPNLSESVRSYLKNINTHLAYADFREERKKLRMSGENLSGYKLVNFLKDYSERRESYIKDVKEIISSNNFQKYDKGNVLN
jgi:Bax protein